MVTLCLAGPAAETLFCGPINDGSDELDEQMARDYLARTVEPLWLAVGIARHRDAAQRLVATPFARRRIPLLAAALLRHGSLSGAEIAALA